MSEDFVQVQPDSTGKKLRTIKRTVGSNDVHEEFVQVAGAGVTGGKYLTPTALSANGTATIWTPASGKKIRLKRVQASTNTATRIDLRFATTAFESYYLPANGSFVYNAIGTYKEGAVDQTLTLLSSAAATVTASADGDEI